ncbi:MAG: hypothetical protein A3F89_06260 [Deltaproteobacteria bacterium RIFCSPLOWO2_12_FULL_50_11]|nr:MAG: hypothetical protein A2053_03385 [Deltaproteobacteria bacterium GWA2_50_8]OGQ27889.1 MAG: hypothetical protein A3B79_07855 [Deltaproteobacteria bacterium RIFCSPHIGHO2_02_FULL_50_15]OGQ66843.1 MAG: hypothetical protein A3F89_06260 [Deltaproteobacteria bacterium RIFCSPLOWO2_12_FULL_50_11]
MSRLWNDSRWLLIIGEIFFLIMSICVKEVIFDIPLYEIVFIRSLFSVFIFGGCLLRFHLSFRPVNIPLMVLRAFSGFVAMSSFFYAIGVLHFGDATMLINTYPLFVALLTYFLFKERLSKELIILILVSWIGIILIIRPQFAVMNVGGLIALMGGFFGAIEVLVIHRLYKTDSIYRIAFYMMVACCLLSLPLLMNHFVVPDFGQTTILLGAGLFGTAGQLTITRAFGIGHTTRVSPLAYLGVVLSYIVGVVFWSEIPHVVSFIGAVIVIGSCIRLAQFARQRLIVKIKSQHIPDQGNS